MVVKVMNKIVILLAAFLLLVGCNSVDETLTAHTIAKFYILVENEDGENLLDGDVEGNILNKKVQYILDGDTLGIAWQHPYHIYDYTGFAYIKEQIFAVGDDEFKKFNVIATDFVWWKPLSHPIDFKITI